MEKQSREPGGKKAEIEMKHSRCGGVPHFADWQQDDDDPDSRLISRNE
jgi:hypothetical protein